MDQIVMDSKDEIILNLSRALASQEVVASVKYDNRKSVITLIERYKAELVNSDTLTKQAMADIMENLIVDVAALKW